MPYATQSDMTLDKTVDGFKTSSKTEEDVVLKSFEITGSEFKDTSFTVNQSYFDIPIETEFESSGFCDISMVPLVYTVSYNGETYGPREILTARQRTEIMRVILRSLICALHR